MLILGISGGLDLEYERNWRPIFVGLSHDSAAVLVEDGKVIYGIEEERLNRIKHTDKAPFSASSFCLNSRGIKLDDIDKIAVYGTEKSHKGIFRLQYLKDPKMREYPDPRTNIHKDFITAYGSDFDDKKLAFVHHHIAHAVSAYYMSGYDHSLILSLDGYGDEISGMVLDANQNETNTLATYSMNNSLGQYYLAVIRYLGYGMHDEYKVMGLAPYGDPKKYQTIFDSFYTLLPEGNYQINSDYISLLYSVIKPRKKGEPFIQEHKDIAAALQKSLENIILHILKHYKAKTKHTNLCLAGGVAHNCSVNGKILYSGMFENIFVQPAAHDAGCAIGAALYEYYQANPQTPRYKLEHVYWGTDIGTSDNYLPALKKWDSFIEYEQVNGIAKTTAELLVKGSVIGWVQGKSEFGPRALGNRSIIADPRPEKHKDIINEMVKKRESYRPFAPSIMEEYLEEFYEAIPKMKQFPYMNFVLKTRPEQQKILGAVTHVDGTARVQTVSKETNPLYWELIDEFRKMTGIPILLNTSFNNNAEPIVDSVQDAIVCYLTTKLDYLVVGDYFIKRKQVDLTRYLKMVPSLPIHIVLTKKKKYKSYQEMVNQYEISNNDDDDDIHGAEISGETFEILNNIDGRLTVEQLINAAGFAGPQTELVINELIRLWTSRYIVLTP